MLENVMFIRLVEPPLLLKFEKKIWPIIWLQEPF